MVDDHVLAHWFRSEVMPLEGALTSFLKRNWRASQDVVDLRQDVYELTISGARRELPLNARAYLFTVARNHLINRSKRARLVAFDLVAEPEVAAAGVDFQAAERHLGARDSLRRIQDGMDRLSPRIREIVQLRKMDGLSARETASRLGIGLDAVNKQTGMGVRALANFVQGGRGLVVRQRRRIPEQMIAPVGAN
jgi:RNA polymerase sigma-70 factor (ECF subfamily)